MTRIARTGEALAQLRREWHAAGLCVGVVPTMGALHAGHVSLARRAREECDRVITTIFVNPRQFENAADLAAYPADLEADAALLAAVPVDLVFAPEVETIYPPGFDTTVSVGALSVPYEGAHRPGHFDGVATVVARLLLLTGAARAYFGEKDWQQLQLVRRMVADLALPVTVIGCETLREADGLALSSRNRRLDAASRERAPALFTAMTRAAAAIRAGESAADALSRARDAVLAAGFGRVDYLDLCDAATLGPPLAGRPWRIVGAAVIGGVRLIDNIAA